MKNFIKRLSDGGLAEDTYAFMERALDENDNKEKMVSLDKVEEFLESCMFNGYTIEDGKEIPEEIVVIKYRSVSELIEGLRKAMEE